MDWTQIIMAVISAIAGGGIVQLFTIQSARRKGNAEARNAEAEAFAKQNNEWMEIVKEYREQAQQVNELRAEINVLTQKVNRLYTANAVALRFYCEEKDCTKRFPPFGTATEEHLQEYADKEKQDYIRQHCGSKKCKLKNKENENKQGGNKPR